MVTVSSAIELQEALIAKEPVIELTQSISLPTTIQLAKGQSLKASKKGTVFLSFVDGDGVGLSGDNALINLAIQTAPDKRAIYLNSTEVDLGTIHFDNLTVTGVVQALTRGNNKTLNLTIDGLDIVSADARHFTERPMKYGVVVHQGALTVYNFNPAEDSHITVTAENVSVGRPMAPVMGSGIFISGFSDETGRVTIEKLTTGDVYSNGMIPNGQPNLITGGIFIVYGAYAKEVISNGPVTTYGTNDMVLDVWGKVDNWIVKDKVTSYGTSGIGFVNFGSVGNFVAEQVVETFGNGARGFNQYDGTITEAHFNSIKTHGNGSIGMQFSKPVGKIIIDNNVSTTGSTGETLVKGVIKNLKADAISVLEGGEIEELLVNGNLQTKGDEVVSYHINGGTVKKFTLKGKLVASGQNAERVVIENGGQTATDSIKTYLNY
ncbi:hypothetical protein ACMZ5S_10180 [Streptococcus pluranimalium]